MPRILLALAVLLGVAALLSASLSRDLPAPARALRALAQAELAFRETRGGGARYAQDLAGPGDEGGYRIAPVRLDQNGIPLDPRHRFAYCAAPAGGEGPAYLVDETGWLYAKETGGAPPARWPADDPTSAGWTVLAR